MFVPSGLSGIRSDFAHYCRVHNAETFLAKLLLPLEASSLLSLAVYRYGVWLYARPRPKLLALPGKLLFWTLYFGVRRVTHVGLSPTAKIGEEVWFASGTPIICMATIGKGSSLHGCNTLGAGGAGDRRGAPTLGENVVISTGAILFGRIEVPAGTVIGPNSVLSRSLSEPGAYLGVPARRFDGPASALIPNQPGTRPARRSA